MAAGADPLLLTGSLFVQHFLVVHAVIDRLKDRLHGNIVFPSDLLRCQRFLPYRLAVQHVGADAAVDEKLTLVRAAALRL